MPLVSLCSKIIWHTVITALYLFIPTHKLIHKFHRVARHADQSNALKPWSKNKQMRKHRTVTCAFPRIRPSFTFLNALNMLPVPPTPPPFPKHHPVTPVSSSCGLAFTWHFRVCKPQTIWAPRGLVDLQPVPPWEDLLSEVSSRRASCPLFSYFKLSVLTKNNNSWLAPIVLVSHFLWFSPSVLPVGFYVSPNILHICKYNSLLVTGQC